MLSSYAPFSNLIPIQARIFATSLDTDAFSSKSPPIVNQRTCSNGSQTDSLDSPPPLSPRPIPHYRNKDDIHQPIASPPQGVAGAGGGGKSNIFQRLLPRFLQPPPNSSSEQQHHQQQGRYNTNVRPKSMYTDPHLMGVEIQDSSVTSHDVSMTSSQDEAARLVDEIAKVAEQFENATSGESSGADRDAAGGTLRATGSTKDATSGGTWPRRHPGGGVPFPVDSGSAFMPPPTTRRRQRAPIKADTYRAPEVEANNNRGSSMDSSSRGMQPPEPPVRKDSFNRGGGGDLIPHHSPQTSDSTLKSFQLQSSNNSSPTKAFSQSQQQQSQNQPPPLPQTDPPPRPSHTNTHPDRKKNTSEDLFGSYSVNTIDSSTSSHHRRMMRASGSSVDSVRNPQNLRTPPKLIGGNIADNGIDSSIVSVPSPVRPTPMRPSTLGPPQSRSAKKDR